MKQDTDRNQEHRSGPRSLRGPAGWHPVGIASGAAVGAMAGVGIGTAVGGPFGALAGCMLCAAIGALFGQTVAETIRPTAEEMYSMRSATRANFSSGFLHPSATPVVAPIPSEAPRRARPAVGAGSRLAVSGLRFPARSYHKNEM